MERVSATLSDGRAFLMHDRWTAADLAFACHIYPCLGLPKVRAPQWRSAIETLPSSNARRHRTSDLGKQTAPSHQRMTMAAPTLEALQGRVLLNLRQC